MYGATMLQSTTSLPAMGRVAPLHRKALLQSRFRALASRITGRSNQLADIASLTGGKTVSNQSDLGVKVVRIAEIKASEDRSDDFDGYFGPLQSHTRSRWLSIAVARLNGVSMPAVDLIRIGDAYAVRDGHHRISVAKALGEDYIDARVTAWELDEKARQ